jgi:hypothetical protein
MKKLFLFPIFFMLICNGVFCQDLKFGIKGELCFASQSIEDPDILSTNSISTLKVTGYLDKYLADGFYLEPGISVAGKGVKAYQNAQTNTITTTYLDIPVNVIYRFSLKHSAKLFAGAGMYVGFGLSGNDENETTNVKSGQSVTFGATEDYKKAEFGGNFTGGIELNNHLTFNLNYQFGLNNIAADQTLAQGTMSVKNRVFSMGLGFLF